MDVFTYIVDLFAITSDEEDLPKNEENPGSGPGAGQPACVIAWDASFLIAWFDDCYALLIIIVRLLLCLYQNVLLMSWTSQKHPQWRQYHYHYNNPHHAYYLASKIFTQRTFLLLTRTLNHILVQHHIISTFVHLIIRFFFSHHHPISFKWLFLRVKIINRLQMQ